MATREIEHLLDVWAVRPDGTKVYPYKLQRGAKKGLYDVSWSGDSGQYQGVTEAELVSKIQAGAFSQHGAVRMLPLDAKPGADRNGHLPTFYRGMHIRSTYSVS